MSQWLMFELNGALASFGGVAPGTVRDSELLPTRSAVLGLLAAACGIERHDAEAQRVLAESLRVAFRVKLGAPMLRDYHTAQAPPEPALKGRPRRTRRDELTLPKDDLNTVLSERYYFCDFAATASVRGDLSTVQRLAAALRAPRFTLFLGRKSCPLGWPIAPALIEADRYAEALEIYDRQLQALWQPNQDARRPLAFVAKEFSAQARALLYGADEGIDLSGLSDGEMVIRTIERWDQPLDTAKRLFGVRTQQRVEVNRESRALL